MVAALWLVADAAGNSIHVVNNNTGEIEWVATLPYEMLDGIRPTRSRQRSMSARTATSTPAS